MFKLLRIFFAWREVRNTGVFSYQENRITGKRRVHTINDRLVQPVDIEWLKGPVKVTRTEYITEYAKRSGLPSPYATLGLLDCGGGDCKRVWIAMPCACGEEGCPGWSMVSADMVDDHLIRRAPYPLSEAYQNAIDASGGK